MTKVTCPRCMSTGIRRLTITTEVSNELDKVDLSVEDTMIFHPFDAGTKVEMIKYHCSNCQLESDPIQLYTWLKAKNNSEQKGKMKI